LASARDRKVDTAAQQGRGFGPNYNRPRDPPLSFDKDHCRNLRTGSLTKDGQQLFRSQARIKRSHDACIDKDGFSAAQLWRRHVREMKAFELF